MSLWRRFLRPIAQYQTFRQDIARNSLRNVIHRNVNITSQAIKLCGNNITNCTIRNKSKKQHPDSDDEKDIFSSDDVSLSKDSKVVKFNTTSMRTDLILKSALGIARNKIETLFYESKIRINGKKILKKSAAVKIGDEIDVIKMISPKNPDHLYVARVEVLNITPQEESITVTTRRFKNLLIENYEVDPYKASAEETRTIST